MTELKSDRPYPQRPHHNQTIHNWRSMQFIRIGNRIVNLNDISLVEIKYFDGSVSNVVMTTIRGETINFDDPAETRALQAYCSNVEDIVQ